MILIIILTFIVLGIFWSFSHNRSNSARNTVPLKSRKLSWVGLIFSLIYLLLVITNPWFYSDNPTYPFENSTVNYILVVCLPVILVTIIIYFIGYFLERLAKK